MTNDNLQIGKRYSALQIHNHVGGGSLRAYLPTKNENVLCARLRLEKNPGTPDQIYVGDGQQIERSADILISQKLTIPVFIRRKSKQWEYMGLYQCADQSLAQKVVAAANVGRKGAPIRRVLYMKKVN